MLRGVKRNAEQLKDEPVGAEDGTRPLKVTNS